LMAKCNQLIPLLFKGLTVQYSEVFCALHNKEHISN